MPPNGASSVHGISTECALEEGQDLRKVLEIFAQEVDQADFLVAHNISFDEKIVGAEFIRNDIQNTLFQKKGICTMKSSTNYCKIPGNYGFKWPSLSELHIKLFGEGFEEAHNAAADINATAKCFWKLKELGVILD